MVEKGRIDYLKGRYIKPDPNDIPEMYLGYQNSYKEAWLDYDQGWHYERYMVPDLHPNLETVTMMANYNFGRPGADVEGYRAFHRAVDRQYNPYRHLGNKKWQFWDGWDDACKMKGVADKYE